MSKIELITRDISSNLCLFFIIAVLENLLFYNYSKDICNLGNKNQNSYVPNRWNTNVPVNQLGT